MQSTTTRFCQHLFHGSTVGNGLARDIWLGTSFSRSLFAKGMHVKIDDVLVQSPLLQILSCACFRASNTCHLRALRSRNTASRRGYMNPIATLTARQISPTVSRVLPAALRWHILYG